MNGMNTSFSTSSIVSSSTRYGADPPVLLGRVEDLVVDPAAVRRLQQRVVEEEAEPAARLAAPGRPRRSPRRRRGCARTRGRRRRRRSWRRRTAAPPPRRGRNDGRRRAARRPRRWFHVGSTPTTSAPSRDGQPADLALAAADVEHAPRAGQLAPPRAAGSAPRTPGRRRR